MTLKKLYVKLKTNGWNMKFDRREEALIESVLSICQEAVDEQMNEAKAILIFAKRKLELYHEAGGGKYLGGLEYSELMKRIDKIINLSPELKEKL